jgi:mRNA interferase MazF
MVLNREILIIQNDLFNRSDIRTTICAVITSNMKLSQMPGNITLEKGVSGLDKTSVINFSIKRNRRLTGL